MHISYSQIKLLMSNPKDWYKKYVNKERDPFFAKSYTVGKWVHKFLETDGNQAVSLMINERTNAYNDWIITCPMEELKKDYEKYIDNAKKLPRDLIEGKKENWFLIDYKGIKIKGYIDLETDDFVIDYKTAWSFTNPDKDFYWKMEEYRRQSRIYSYYTKKDAKIVEIGKAKNSKICPEWYQVFDFPYSKKNDIEVEKLFDKCIKWMDIYKSMNIEDIPTPLNCN